MTPIDLDPDDLARHLRNCFGVPSDYYNLSKPILDARLQLQQCESSIKLTRLVIEEQEARLAELKKQKQTLQRTIEGYKSLSAPIRRLPLEIVQSIFKFVCSAEGHILLVKPDPDQSEYDADNGTDIEPELVTRIPPLRLSHVCSAWRSLSLSTPSLWSTMQVILDAWRTSPIFDFLLSISQPYNAPLNLIIRMFSGVRWWSSSDPGIKPLKSLTAHSHRFSQLTLQVHPSIYRHPVFFHIQGNLPLLSSLCVLTLENPEAESAGYADPDVGDLFLDAPKLREFRTNLSDLRLIRLPGGQLSKISLELSHHTAEILSRCLFFCTNLEELELETSESDEEISFGVPGVTAGGVQTLRLGINSSSGDSGKGDNFAIARLVFGMLTLPRLEKLHITGYESDSEFLYDGPDGSYYPDYELESEREDLVQTQNPELADSSAPSGHSDTPSLTWKSDWPRELIGPFLERSRCMITSLSLLHLHGPTDEEVLELLWMLPSLEHLEIYERNTGILDLDIDTVIPSPYPEGGEIRSGERRVITKTFMQSFSRVHDADRHTASHSASPSSKLASDVFLPNLMILKLAVSSQHLEEITEEALLLLSHDPDRSGTLTTLQLYENYDYDYQAYGDLDEGLGYPEPVLRTRIVF